MQFAANEARHADLRDSFIHLWINHDTAAAQNLYLELIGSLPKQSTESLLKDQKRTSIIASNSEGSYQDLVWRYYSSVNKELEKRDKKMLALNKGNK
jgi:hypothetical protein